ncbi:hypothetical protein [Natrinema sp. H-ect4]|uniref:hypothetical protein n=1 Tax=Natrinema sp. H-ect4 TaxID=3242699 RepID=UPI0035A8780F
MTDFPDTITWSRTVSSSKVGRFCLYLLVGLFGGVAALPVLFFLLSIVTLIGVGNYRLLAVVVLFTLIGGPFSLLYLLPLLLDREQRPLLGGVLDRAGYDRLGKPQLAASAIFGALILVGLFLVHPLIMGIIFIGGTLVSTVGMNISAPEGKINTDTQTFHINGQTFNLDGLKTLYVHKLGDLAILRPSFINETVVVTSPVFVSIPWEVYEEAKPVFKSSMESQSEPSNPPERGERIALGIFGGGALSGAIGLGYLGFQQGGDGAVVLYWAASLVGLFGLVFLVLAFRTP